MNRILVGDIRRAVAFGLAESYSSGLSLGVKAAVTILNQIHEVDFKGFSYGFRLGRGPYQAPDALTVGIQRSA